MNELNEALQRQVEALGELCCQSLKRDAAALDERATPLIEALVQNGYERISDISLQARLEAIVLNCCPEKAIHRRDEMIGIIRNWQAKFTQLARWDTSSPRGLDRPKAANISSARDS